MTSPPPGIPQSDLYAIRETPTSGRGLFAIKPIPAGTTLHTASDLSANTIYRQYRREVCCWCFDYDRGVFWPLRDTATGLVFCGKKCRREWGAAHGDKVTLRAYEAVETLVKSRMRKDKDEDMVDAAGVVPPVPAEIERAWKMARTEGRRIINARTSLEPMKAETRALKAALAKPADPIVLPYLLSAVLVAHHSPEQWESVLELKPTPTPYASTVVLDQHITAYHHLLSVLPEPLLQATNPTTLLAAVDRDSHNSFGLRSLDDDGDEMFGFGVWASASYWNHSCSPSVEKERVGRTWRFWAKKDVQVGEELCITYLGLETEELAAEERRKRLRETWGFECGCGRCVEESRAQVVDEPIQYH